MSLTPGRMLSHYQLAELIGEGGMGVVWRARDTTLDRDVAIKFLPDAFVADLERMARFEREARLLASLNHPNIAAIYGLDSADGIRFLTMEMVEGEDLALRLRRGALPAAEALPLARHITEALETAHEKGIVHRDLKPANLKLTRDGQVKVLDFGLARAFEGDRAAGSGSNLSQSPTITAAITSANVVLGTAAYMSPEQARGQAIDRRTDIWAFGVVLFEMLTGRQLFEGETISDTLAAVLRADLDWASLPAETPARVRALLRRCLERNPRLRLRDIGEARILLDEVMRGGAEAAPAPGVTAAAPAWRAPPLPLFAASLIVTAVVAFLAAWMLHRTTSELPLRRFQLPAAGSANAAPALSRISPDGRAIVYFISDTLWIQRLDALDPRRLAVAGAPPRALFWSPDSKQVGFMAGTSVRKVPVAGGASEVVCDTRAPSTGGSGASWRDDGVIVFSRGDSAGILQVPAAGGDAQPLIKPDLRSESDLHEPAALPGRRGILLVAHRQKGGFDNVTLWSGGKRKVLLELSGQEIWRPIYAPPGHILFRRTGTNPGIWALPFSLSRLAVTGPPFLVEPDANEESVSDDGTLACLVGGGGGLMQFELFSRDGDEPVPIGQPVAMDRRPALSAGGRRIVYSQRDGDHRDLWIQDVERDTRTRLTFEPGDEWFPSWSPDGERVVYQSLPANAGDGLERMAVLMRRADGTGAVDTLAFGAGANFTPDGREVTFTHQISSSSWGLYAASLEGDRKPRLFLDAGAFLMDPRVSPAGNLISYMSNESGDWQVYLKRYPSGEGKWQVSTVSGQWPRWNAKGDRLYYVQGADVMEVEVTGTTSPVLSTPRGVLSTGALPSPSSRWIPAVEVTGDGQHFLTTLDATTTSRPRGVTVVQNWFARFEPKR